MPQRQPKVAATRPAISGMRKPPILLDAFLGGGRRADTVVPRSRYPAEGVSHLHKLHLGCPALQPSVGMLATEVISALFDGLATRSTTRCYACGLGPVPLRAKAFRWRSRHRHLCTGPSQRRFPAHVPSTALGFRALYDSRKGLSPPCASRLQGRHKPPHRKRERPIGPSDRPNASRARLRLRPNGGIFASCHKVPAQRTRRDSPNELPRLCLAQLRMKQ